MRILVEVLPNDAEERREGYRWMVSGEGIPTLEGLSWTARTPQRINMFAKMLALQHGCPAWLNARGVVELLFEPTPAAIAAYNANPFPTLEQLGATPRAKSPAAAGGDVF